MDQFQEALQKLEQSLTFSENKSVLSLCVYVALAGLLALYVRQLYRWCSATVSDADSVSRTFPILAMVTAGVIAVVKSSLALSLGLVGALSIVRFRAAIKDPEELVYLFLCIAIGLALGAEQPLLAAGLVGVTSVFIVTMHWTSGKDRKQRLLLTVSGDADQYFGEKEGNLLNVLDEVVSGYALQRLELADGQGLVRVVLRESNTRDCNKWIAELRQRLPDCELSYINLNNNL